MYEQGEILIVPIPFSDLSSNKKRPVLVLSNTEYNRRTNDIVITAITSNLTEKDYVVMITNNDLELGSLKADSCIRADKIYTLAQKIVASSFGKVKPYIVERVKEKIAQLMLEK
jgi:mRNA interferase MazF